MKTPVTTYRAPTSFPIFAAVCGSTRPAAPRFCSSSNFCSSSRSTTRTAAPAARSEIINPAIPFWRASKLSLSCPYEPPLSNGKTAIPGRLSCPWAWPASPATAGHSRAAVLLELLRRVHRVVDQELRVGEECDEVLAPRRRSLVMPPPTQLVIGDVRHARSPPGWRQAIPQRRAGVPQPHGAHAERAHRE